MALFDDDAGKTEKATPKRLGDARKKGRTPLSREFTMAGSLLIAVLVLEQLGGWLIDRFGAVMRTAFELPVASLDRGDPPALVHHLQATLATVAPPLLTLMAVFVCATALCGYGQIGLQISSEAVGFKPERLNPAANLARLFSFSSLTRTGLSVLKLAVLASVLWLVLRTEWQRLAALHRVESLAVALGIVAHLALRVFFWIALVVLVLSTLDVAWQRYDFHKSLMMTRKEVEDERKSSEGDPLIKSRLRSARMELMKQRLMEAVPKADVLITNPTHYAVAIRYERAKNRAPIVIAKGADELALKMREIAEQHDVPRLEDPPLARALFRSVKVGQEIPEKFYKAVAAVLSHVYRIKGRVA